MSSKLRVVLIGCGRVAARYYLPILTAFHDIEVIGAVDPVEERRNLISGRFEECVPYESLDDSLISRMNAGIITSPPNTHIQLASEILRRDGSVLVEKPLASSMDGIKELRKLESSSKGSLMMAFSYRYWLPIAKLKNDLAGKAGLDSVKLIFTSDYRQWEPVSFVSDPLDDLGPHVFDLIRFVFNAEILSIIADARGGNQLELTVRLPGNVRIHCHMAHCNETNRSIRAEGRFHITQNSVRLWPEPGPIRNILDLADRIKMKLLGQTFPIKKTFELQLRKYFEMVRSGQPADPNIENGISAILAVEAARTSMKNDGKEIFLSETA